MASKTVVQDAPRQTLYMPLAEPSGKNRRVGVIQRLAIGRISLFLR
jgi:hypothetical protein